MTTNFDSFLIRVDQRHVRWVHSRCVAHSSHPQVHCAMFLDDPEGSSEEIGMRYISVASTPYCPCSECRIPPHVLPFILPVSIHLFIVIIVLDGLGAVFASHLPRHLSTTCFIVLSSLAVICALERASAQHARWHAFVLAIEIVVMVGIRSRARRPVSASGVGICVRCLCCA